MVSGKDRTGSETPSEESPDVGDWSPDVDLR